jgi:L-seryl-tRNA(Ser) seleniumtransferase
VSLPSDSAAKISSGAACDLRALPSVDELVSRPAMVALAETVGRGTVTQVARNTLAQLRAELQSGGGLAHVLTDSVSIEARITHAVRSDLAPSLRRVINATGVILHTNLGRAPLSTDAVVAIAESASRYSNLEYDTETGERGKRDVHTSRMLATLAGAQSAIVVNNNAAAVFLVLNTLAKGAEVVVSRGELIEIGDGFRIPDIMSESGAILREVGTTNRTHIGDYERAISGHTRLLLRVHPSNFRITGFTERPSLAQLVALGGRAQLPVYEDLGSGCVANLSGSGIAEPVVSASCKAGASVVSFSGDKLLGGPQAGIIVGQKEIVDRIGRNPLFRALRVDKLTIAALEATLKIYLRGALDGIPTLRMIRLPLAAIGSRAAQFIERIRPLLPQNASVELQEGFSVVGGGSTPDQQLPTHLIAVERSDCSAPWLEERLRKTRQDVPVIARIENDRVVLDLRTVLPDEGPDLASSLIAALS